MRFLALVSNVDLLKENIANAQNSEDIGTLQALKAMDSLESKLNQVQVAYQQFYTTIGVENVWKGFLDGTKSVIDTLNNLPKLFGAIPLNAVAVIGSAISLIKTIALQGVAQIILQVKNNLKASEGEIVQVTGEIGKNAAQAAVNQANNEIKKANFAQTIKKSAGDIANSIGAVGVMIGAIMDKTTKSGREAAGVVTGLGGAFQAIGGIVNGLVSGNWAGPILTIATGIINIINGFSIAFESTSEKLERLTQEAENLNNEAKKAKAEYNTLDRSIKKIDELKLKRNESIEATEEYHEAVNELADSFPQLVIGFDEVGNAIYDAKNAELLLAEARRKAATDTYTAAKKEQERAQGALDNSINDVTGRVIPELLKSFDVKTTLQSGKSIGLYSEFQEYTNFLRTLQFGTSNDNKLFQMWLNRGEQDFANILLQNADTIRELAKTNPKQISVGAYNEKYTLDILDYLEKNVGVRVNAENTAQNEILETISKISTTPLDNANINNILNDLKTLINNYIETNGYDTFINTLLDEESGYYNELINGLSEIQANQLTTNLDSRNVALAGVNLYNTKQWSGESLLNSLAANIALNDTQQYDSEFEKYNSAITVVDNWIKKSGQDFEHINHIFSNLENYTEEDVYKLLNITNEDAQIKQAIADYYNYYINDIASKIEGQLASNGVFGTAVSQGKFNSVLGLSLITEAANLVTDYENKGLEENAMSLRMAASNIFNILGSLADENTEQFVGLQQILHQGFSTKEQIQSTIDTIQSDIDDGIYIGDIAQAATEIITLLNDMQSQMVYNYIAALKASYGSNIEKYANDQKTLSKLSKGMGIDEVYEFLTSSLNTMLKDPFDINDFQMDTSGNYKLDDNQLEQYWQEYINKTYEINEDIQKFNESLKDNLDLEKIKNDSDALTKLGFDLSTDTEITDEEIEEAIKTFKESYQATEEQLQKLEEDAIAQLHITLGKYEEFLDGLTVEEFASKKITKDDKNYRIKKEAQQTLNEAYSNLISDALSKGLENINPDDYTGLISTDIIDTTIGYQEFVNKYVGYTGKILSEINELIVQAIEKDKKPEQQIKDLIKDINFINQNAAYASLDTIRQLADILQRDVRTMFDPDSFNELLGGYKITNFDFSGIKDAETLVADSVNEFLQSIVDAIGNGIQGKLTYQGRDELIAQLGQLGINSITAADFTQTADGLKLSVDAAYELYKALSQIDTYKGQLVFDDLYDSLTQTGEACENILTTMASIATAEGNLGKVPNGDLQERLNLYRQIARVQMDNPDSYKFMDNKLPTSMQGAVNFYSDWAEAAKTIKSSSASGYMGMQDFYNIINEINNMAAISGEVKLGAYTLDGNLSSAAELIQKAFDNLEMVDGKGMMVKLSGIGEDFSFAGADFSAGVDSGLQDFARSQIDMLDGIIAMLETVVKIEEAMDGLGEGMDEVAGENHQLDMGEIFNFSIENGEINEAQYTDEFRKKVLEPLQDKIKQNTELQELLKEYYVSGKTLLDIIQNGNQGLEGLSGEEILKIGQFWQSLYDLLSHDYDLENLVSDVTNLIEESGLSKVLSGFHFDKEANIGILITPELGAVKIEFDEEKLRQIFGEDKTIEEVIAEAKEILNKYAKGTLNVGEVEYTQFLQLIGVIEVETDESGNQIYKYKGHEYTKDEFKQLVEQLKKNNLPSLESLNSNNTTNVDDNGVLTFTTTYSGVKTLVSIGPNSEIKYTVNNTEYDSLSEAIRNGNPTLQGQEGKAAGSRSIDYENITFEGVAGTATVRQYFDTDGNITYITDVNGTAIKASSFEELEQAVIAYLKDNPTDTTTNSPESEAAGDEVTPITTPPQTLTLKPGEVTVETKDLQDYTVQQIQEAKEAVKKALNGEELNDDEKDLIVTINPDIQVGDGQFSKEGLEGLANALNGIEDKIITLTVIGDDAEWLQQLVESKDNPIPVTATISVTNGKGEAGGEGGGITADGTYSIDTIQLAATAIQLVQGEGGKPTVNAVGLGTLLTGAIYLATQLATLIPGDAFDTSVDKLPLDNIPLQQAILKVINILLDAAESKVNDVGVVAAAKANPFSIDNLTATVLALLLTAAPEAVDQSGLPVKNGSTLAEHIGLLKAWVDSILVNASDADVNNSGVKAQIKSTPIDVETITAIVNDILAQLGVNVDPQSEMSALIPDNLSTDKDLSVNVTPKYQLAPGAHTPTEEELNTLLGITNLPQAQRDENGYIILPGTQTGYQGQGPEYTPPTEQNAQEVIINGNNVEVNGENSNTPAPSDNTNTAGQFEGAAQAAKEAATEMSGAADTVTTVSIDAKAAVAQTQSDIQSSAEQIESTAADVAAKTSELGGAAESAAGNVENLVGAINSIPSNTEIGIGVSINVDVSSQTGYAPVTSATIHAPITNKPVAANSKGNVALSKGRKTLMGELGPELVVSHGRYYVVGENGAEFVDLDDDAIVFNHLQTKRLLQNGITSRGAPITNERNAISFATGTQGPALASAAQALAQLKQIRAMWESMLTATLSSLGKQAGSGGGKGKGGGGGGKGKSGDGSGSSGGGGGGGGGGGEDDKEVNAAYIADLERWYNLLRQIAKLEQDITYEEQLRSKIESDRVVNGSALYESRKRQLDQLDQEIAKNKELSALQKSYYDARRKDLESTNFGKIFTFDENGLMQWNDNAVMANGQRGGLFALEELNRMDEYGRPAYTARQQYEMLKSWGFSAEMEYDNNGNKIELEDINDEEGYAKMVQAFNDRMDGWKDELDSLYDSYNEQLEKATSNETKRNELLQQIVDNQLSVEKSVLGAIEAREKAVIDELKNEQTALKESTDAYLDGLNRQLDQEKQLYARQDQDQELTRLQRQLAILQRTGGSASQIRSLQNEIANKSQDRYFDLQQEQIDAVKDAAEKQQEQLDQQIKIMEETLEYQKENGLLWAEVAQVMQGTPQEITAFIAQYTPSYRSNSELQIAEDLRKLTGEVEDWVAYRDDEDEKVSTALAFPWESFVESTNHRYDELLSGEVGIIARAMFDELYSQTGDSTKSGIAVLEWLEGTYGPGAPQELTPEQEAAQAEAQKTREWAQELYEELLGISQITGPNTQAQRKKALSETGFNKNDILKILETYYADVIALGLGPNLLQGNGTQKDYDPKFALQEISEKYFKNKYGDSDVQVSNIMKDMLPLLQRLAEGSTYKIDLINNSTYTPDVQLGTLMNPYWGNMTTELESLVTTLRPTSGGSFPESKYSKQIITDWLMKQWKTWQAPGVAIKKKDLGDRRISGGGGGSSEPTAGYRQLNPVLQTALVGNDTWVYVDVEGNIYKVKDNDIRKDYEARQAGYTGGLVMTKEQYDAWMPPSSVSSASQANKELEHLKAVYGATSISDLKGRLGSDYKLPSGYTLSELGGVLGALSNYDTAFNAGLNVGTLNAEINITTTDANVGQEVVDALNAAMQKTARRVP